MTRESLAVREPGDRRNISPPYLVIGNRKQSGTSGSVQVTMIEMHDWQGDRPTSITEFSADRGISSNFVRHAAKESGLVPIHRMFSFSALDHAVKAVYPGPEYLSRKDMELVISRPRNAIRLVMFRAFQNSPDIEIAGERFYARDGVKKLKAEFSAMIQAEDERTRAMRAEASGKAKTNHRAARQTEEEKELTRIARMERKKAARKKAVAAKREKKRAENPQMEEDIRAKRQESLKRARSEMHCKREAKRPEGTMTTNEVIKQYRVSFSWLNVLRSSGKIEDAKVSRSVYMTRESVARALKGKERDK